MDFEIFVLLRPEEAWAWRVLALACDGPGGKLGLSWKVRSRLESRGRSLDLEETSCKTGVGSVLALEVEYQFGAILWGPIPFPKILPSRSLSLPRCGHHSCFSIVIKFSRNLASLAPSVNVGWGERRIMGVSGFSVMGRFSVIWVVLCQRTSQRPGWILRLF